MAVERSGGPGPERVRRALAGERVVPAVRGMSFVAPSLLQAGSPSTCGEPPGADAHALARACADARLDFAFVPSWEPWASEAAGLLLDAAVAVAWVVPGVLWPVLEARGVLSALRLTLSAPPELSASMDAALEQALAGVDAGLRHGATFVVVADDMAGAAGPLLEPSFLDAEVFPRLARLAGASRERGVPAVLHCDGDARLLMGAAREAGFVGVHGDAGGGARWETAAEAARKAGLAFLGGIPTAALADPASAAAAGSRAFVVASGGGVLVSDDGGVTLACEAETLLAVLAGGAQTSGEKHSS